MENKINIAEILKDKPQGTKLYSPICGEVLLDKVDRDLNKCTIFTINKSQNHYYFMADGKYEPTGECMLFPSKDMRDWSKFTWKKGDVMVSNNVKTEVLFDRFTDDNYNYFIGKHYLTEGDGVGVGYLEEQNCLATKDFHLEDKDAAQCYINTVEERFEGKLNMETLEIEKLEFKEGDFVTIKEETGFKEIGIFSGFKETEKPYHEYVILRASYSVKEDVTDWFKHEVNIEARTIHYATEEEKQQLFDALEKEGKCWNAETKQIEDIKPKWTPKPFNKVLVRNGKGHNWTADFYSFTAHRFISGEERFVCVGGGYDMCIPYNEKTAHLIGTTDDYEED